MRLYNKAPNLDYYYYAGRVWEILDKLANEHLEDAPTLRLLAHSMKPEIYASQYHEFLSQCLIEKGKVEKDKGKKLTLGDTQRNFKACNKEWKKFKLAGKKEESE